MHAAGCRAHHHWSISGAVSMLRNHPRTAAVVAIMPPCRHHGPSSSPSCTTTSNIDLNDSKKVMGCHIGNTLPSLHIRAVSCYPSVAQSACLATVDVLLPALLLPSLLLSYTTTSNIHLNAHKMLEKNH